MLHDIQVEVKEVTVDVRGAFPVVSMVLYPDQAEELFDDLSEEHDLDVCAYIKRFDLLDMVSDGFNLYTMSDALYDASDEDIIDQINCRVLGFSEEKKSELLELLGGKRMNCFDCKKREIHFPEYQGHMVKGFWVCTNPPTKDRAIDNLSIKPEWCELFKDEESGD